MEIVVGKQCKNRWDEVVEVSEFDGQEVVVLYVGEGYVDVISKEDFVAFFRVVKNGCK